MCNVHDLSFAINSFTPKRVKNARQRAKNGRLAGMENCLKIPVMV